MVDHQVLVPPPFSLSRLLVGTLELVFFLVCFEEFFLCERPQSRACKLQKRCEGMNHKSPVKRQLIMIHQETERMRIFSVETEIKVGKTESRTLRDFASQ